MMPRMIATIVQTGFRSLRRDRVAFILSFVLPVAFFTIFGFVFGSMRSSSAPRVSVLVVDEDKSSASRALISGLLREPSLDAATHPKPTKGNPAPPEYTAVTAEAAVRKGEAPAALIIPLGFSAHPISFSPGSSRLIFQILNDSSDPVAAQVLAGMLQKTVMMSLPRHHGHRRLAVLRSGNWRSHPSATPANGCKLSRPPQASGPAERECCSDRQRGRRKIRNA
jgi:ABC-2 type transport system permease protein